MAKDESTAKLKLVHLLYIILAATLGIGIAWGALANQQGTNTDAIDEKVEKEIFNMHQTQQAQQFTRIEGWMEKIDKKLEK